MIVINMHQIFTSKNFKFTICLSDRVEENVSKHVCNDFGNSGHNMHYKEPWPLLFNFWELKLAEHAKDLLQSSPQSLRHWEKHDVSPDIFLFAKPSLLRGIPVLAIVCYIKIWITIIRKPYIKPTQPIKEIVCYQL